MILKEITYTIKFLSLVSMIISIVIILFFKFQKIFNYISKVNYKQNFKYMKFFQILSALLSFLEGVIAEKLVESLQKYEIRATAVTRRELHENGIGEDFLRARDRSAALLTELYKKEMKEKEAFNINAIVQDLPKDLYKKLKGDVLAFVEYDHISKTKGARTTDMMISVVGALATGRASSEPSERQLVLIYFIDAQTGSLIWSNLNQFYLEARKKEKEPNRIKEITTEILLPLKQKKKKK